MPLFNIYAMNIEFSSMVVMYDQYISIIPAIIAGAGALASGIISASSAKKRNQREVEQRQKEALQQLQLQRSARQTEDSDKMDSLRRAGLNPNLAYSGGTPIQPTINPASVESQGDGLANSLKDGSKGVADLTQSQPAVDAGVENTVENTNVQRATAEKTKEEAEALRLQNEATRGENESSRFKLKQLGLIPDSLSASQATGYLKGIDFAEEFKTKGAERGARSAVAKVNEMFNSKISTDEDFKRRFLDGQIAVFDNYVTTNDGNKLSNALKAQDLSLYGLRKSAMQLGNMKTLSDIGNVQANTAKLRVDTEKVRADVQTANESSYLNIFKNCADALRTGDAETFAYWNTIGAIKSGQFDNWQKALMQGSYENNTIYKVFGQISKEMSLTNKNHWRGTRMDEDYSMPNYSLKSHGQINSYVKSYGRYPYEKH